MVDKIYGQQEIMEVLRKTVAEKGSDSFRAKISRKENQSQMPNPLASFDGCTLEHLSNTETWLPVAFGGGWYSITLAHSSSPGDNIAGPLSFSYPPSSSFPVKKPSPREIVEIMAQPWAGPNQLKFPIPDWLMSVKGQTYTIDDPIPPLKKETPVTATPSSPVVNEAATILSQHAASTSSSNERLEISRLSQVNEMLSREKHEIERQRMQMEQESFRNEMKQMLSSASRPSGGGGGIQETIATMTPLILAFMKSKDENDKFVMQMQIETANRQAEFMKSMMTKPPSDPLIERLVEKIDKMTEKKDDMGQMKMVAEMMGTMAQTSMSMIQAQAELVAASQPEQESPQFKLAGKALEALTAVFGKAGQAVSSAVIDDTPVQAALPDGLEGIPEQVTEKPKFSQMELLERSLKRKDAKEKVLERFVKAMGSKKFKDMVRTQYRNDLLALIQDRLGPWAMSGDGNLQYLQETCGFVFEEATKLGVLRVKKPAAQAAGTPEKNGVSEEHPVSQENIIPQNQTVTA